VSEAATRIASATWRDIGELAELVGAYCWVERRMFALTGAWASEPAATGNGEAELAVWCAAASRRHGLCSERWAERLPVRAGIDASGLVAAPPGPIGEAFDALAAEPGRAVRVTVLLGAVLPRLGRVYEAHLEAALPVSEAPDMEVLAQAQREIAGEIRGGRTLVAGFPEGRARGESLRDLFERAFEETGIFPAVRAS
jgi:hypothetical protein